jgi:hypothetical protein
VLQGEVQDFTARTGPEVPRLLGGGKQSATGRVDVNPEYSSPSVLATTEWNGDMTIRHDVAKSVADALDGQGVITDPAALTVPLHELIHSTTATSMADGRGAYFDPGNAAIEEGFTELGTIQHAAEFFGAAGVGRRPTGYTVTDAHGSAVPNPAFDRGAQSLIADLQKQYVKLSAPGQGPPQQQAADRLGRAIENLKRDHGELVWGAEQDSLDLIRHLGDPGLADWAAAMKKRADAIRQVPRYKPLTMTGYARKVAGDREGIIGGDAWGHYPVQTKLALEWAEEVAMAERQGGLRGKALDARVGELADEVNRQGADGKVGVMAGQVVRALGWELSGMSSGDLSALEHEIRSRWLEQGSIIAFEYAKGVAKARAAMTAAAAKYRRERAPA